MDIAAQASLMVKVLLLEVLGLQKHPLPPENRAKRLHHASLHSGVGFQVTRGQHPKTYSFVSRYSPSLQTMGAPGTSGGKAHGFNTPIDTPASEGVVRLSGLILTIPFRNQTLLRDREILYEITFDTLCPPL
jgi:hypothetical protein